MELFPRERADPAPGVVHLPDWLSPAEQRELVAACREWARPPAGMRTVRMPNGGEMSVRSLSLGWHWYPYRYVRTVEDGDGSPVKPFPPVLGELARRALADAYGPEPTGIAGTADYRPDIGVVNHYAHGAHMGLHQDKDERVDAPVVSLSIGDGCVFRLGKHRDQDQAVDRPRTAQRRPAGLRRPDAFRVPRGAAHPPEDGRSGARSGRAAEYHDPSVRLGLVPGR